MTVTPEVIKAGLGRGLGLTSRSRSIDGYRCPWHVIDEARKLGSTTAGARKLHSRVELFFFTWLQRDKNRRVTINPVAGVSAPWGRHRAVAERVLKPAEVATILESLRQHRRGLRLRSGRPLLLDRMPPCAKSAGMTRAELGDRRRLGTPLLPQSRII